MNLEILLYNLLISMITGQVAFIVWQDFPEEDI